MTANPFEFDVETSSPHETFELGAALGGALAGGMTVALIGPLGAGKTQLVKGIAFGNAVGDVRAVTSPTFTLLNEYPGRLTLYHLDAYRLPGSRALLGLGFDELARPDSAVVIEWADRVPDIIPTDAVVIEISPTGPHQRSLRFRSTEAVSGQWLEAFRAARPV
ncbi:MAG: tRNA (adenosine(37)-N6)-threonylcarbamoyltransferase complex ATPase subunit type 1 TsaE [Planctomycetes bacterium]|nr:tRNA (adenosine(37)-N6)-threonylcarbamoyltransferase complex ATPase subunit type 1 TsaE [Planctomycetota bacterium]